MAPYISAPSRSAIGRIERQGAVNDGRRGLGDPGGELLDGARGLPADLEDQLSHGLRPGVRGAPGEHLVENDAERKEVRPLIDRLFAAAPGLLGRHVERRADHRVGSGDGVAGGWARGVELLRQHLFYRHLSRGGRDTRRAGLGEIAILLREPVHPYARDPEIERILDEDLPVMAGEKDVRRLDVSVDDVRFVGFGETTENMLLGYADSEPARSREGRGRGAADRVLDGSPPRGRVHHDVRPARFFIHRPGWRLEGVRRCTSIDPPRGHRLALKAIDDLLVLARRALC